MTTTKGNRMTKYSVTFGEQTFTRQSEAAYTHAAYRRRGIFESNVTFHKTHAAAVRSAGRYGAVKAIVAL